MDWGNKQLYRVDVKFTYYAFAESDLEAESDKLLQQALEIEADCGGFEARRVRYQDEPIEETWDHPTSLVYHDGRGEITLAECLKDLPARISKKVD